MLPLLPTTSFATFAFPVYIVAAAAADNDDVDDGADADGIECV